MDATTAFLARRVVTTLAYAGLFGGACVGVAQETDAQTAIAFAGIAGALLLAHIALSSRP